MKRINIIFGFLAMFIGLGALSAQDSIRVTGKVLSPYRNVPVANAVITASEISQPVRTDSTGIFQLTLPSLSGTINVWAENYYSNTKPVTSQSMVFIMIPENKFNYNEELVVPFGHKTLDQKSSAMVNINENNFGIGDLYIDDVLGAPIPGLKVIDGGGMPGEGSYINARGINSLISNSTPLIVIDGIPYLPDMSESPVIGGYAQNIFNPFSATDIKNITFIKGAEVSLYGSLGANGVLLIETDDATDLETRVSFVAQYGLATQGKTMPVLNVDDYKRYIGDVALTYYDDMGNIIDQFPFMKEDPDYYYNYLYNNKTNWQEEIFTPALVTENILKIKGGDAIAKYDLSFGYLNHGGTIENSGLQRYSMRLNSNINISQKLNMFTSMSLSYFTNKLHEQGIINETNPILAALAKSPMLSPFEKDKNNNLLPGYASIRDEQGEVITGYGVSNPLALTNTTKITNEGSDVLMSGGLNYIVNNDLKLTGMVGVYNNYSRSEVFVPGITSGTIMPLENGLANNTVRTGIREAFNYYYNIHATYNKMFEGLHNFSVKVGWQSLATRKEFDAGEGRNTSSDFYKTLDNVSSIGRSFYGYINKWRWANGFVHASYNYNHLYVLGMNLSIDGSSSTGIDATAMGVFPGISAAVNLQNMRFLSSVAGINRFVVRGEYITSGNSNFNSNLADYYYRNNIFRELSGIVRANIPNTSLKWENSSTLNLGFDFSGFKNRLDLTIDLYSKMTSDVIIPKDISSAFGVPHIYDNLAQIKNTGAEAGIQMALVSRKNFEVIFGGTASTNNNKVTSLGGESDRVIMFGDGAALITREGEPVYSFYGFETNGVYATSSEAQIDDLTDYAGNEFGAGDMKFVDQDDDGIIDDNDRVIIGDPNPLMFGQFFSMLRFKKISLFAGFSYSYGNDAYNAVRREFETMDDFANKYVSVKRRWTAEGQETDIPRAVFGDPLENGRFSDRWIEDASYIKLKELTISYDFARGDIGSLRGGTIYISGQNLLTFTNYLGYDPEFSYSYLPYKQGIDFGKAPIPRTVKIGFKLQF
jgi:TonB-linked SusC/RagA family outer membrane protein